MDDTEKFCILANAVAWAIHRNELFEDARQFISEEPMILIVEYLETKDTSYINQAAFQVAMLKPGVDKELARIDPWRIIIS